MAAEMGYSCDVCGIRKGTGNHWFKVRPYNRDPKQGEAELIVCTWASQSFPIERHACSDKCVSILVQQWLSAQKESTEAINKALEDVK